MRLPTHTLIDVFKSIAGSILDDDDARPGMASQIVPTLEIPTVLTDSPLSATVPARTSYCWDFMDELGASEARAGTTLTTLGSGYWRISGEISTVAGIASTISTERTTLSVVGVFPASNTHFFWAMQKNNSRSFHDFDFRVLLPAGTLQAPFNYAILLTRGPTAAADFVRSVGSFRFEKLL